MTAPAHDATIDKFTYTPHDVQIHAGDTVVWHNHDGTVHTVTATRSEFQSNSIRPGQSFAVTFDTPGVYPYFCEPHEFMRGLVSVLPARPGAALRPGVFASAVRGHPRQPAPVGAVAGAALLAALVWFGLARRGLDAARVVAIAATLATGALHLELRLQLNYPEPIGTLLVIEAGGAAVLAAWLAAAPFTRHKANVAVAAHLAALGALAVTRTPLGLFGFHELGWDPSPQLPLALAISVVAVVALVSAAPRARRFA